MIHRIHITNFKSLHDVTVDFDPLTVLIGRSGSGKTNLVNGIRFLREYLERGQEFLNSLLKTGKWGETVSASLDEPSVRIECEFSVSGIPEPFAYAIEIGRKSEGSNVQCLDEALTLAGEEVFHVREGKYQSKGGGTYQGLGWVVSPKLLNLPDPQRTQPPFLAAFPALEEAVVAHVALTRGIGCYDFPGDVLQAPGKPRKEEKNGGFSDDGSNYLDTMRDIVSNLSDLTVRKQMVAALRQISPTAASVELDDHRNPKSAIVSHSFDARGRLGLKLDQESEGLRRFYAHLLAMNQVPPKQTLIFEEPEKGIYPGALEVLANEFQNCAKRGQSQIMLTTHSPALLDHFDPECIRVVDIDANATKVGRMESAQAEAIKSELFSTGELLTVDPARVATPIG